MSYVVLHSTLDTHLWLQKSSYDQWLGNAPQEGMLTPIVTTYSLPSAKSLLCHSDTAAIMPTQTTSACFLIGVLVGDNFLSAANEQGKLLKVAH